MADKSYEAYEMLAKLLNSEQKENIDRAYNALSEALDQAYSETVKEKNDEFSKKRDALARNKAVSDKYLSYFMTDKGYAGSGTEADAKLKSQLGYNSDLAALGAAETAALSDAEAKYKDSKLKNETERNSKKAAADKELGDSLYKIYNDAQENELQKEKLKNETETKNRQMQIDRELKDKEYEIKLLQAQTANAKASEADKAENEALKEKLSSYRQHLYNETLDKFKRATDISEMQQIYDSVTGVNAETAADVFGEKLYSDMVKTFSKALSEAKVKRADEAAVQKLYDRFVNAKDEYHQKTYMKLKRELAYSNFPGFTEDQLERAYKLYLNNGLSE